MKMSVTCWRCRGFEMTGRALLIFCLSFPVALGQRITYTKETICALKGSTVELPCHFDFSHYTIKNTFWFKTWEAGEPEPIDLSQDPEYAGRVEYIGDLKNDCTLQITNLRESDSAVYRFRVITDLTGGQYAGYPGVNLSVKDLKVEWTSTYSSWKTLTCSTTCVLADSTTFIWYQNGRKWKESPHPFYSDYHHTTASYTCAIKGKEVLHSPSVCINEQSCNKLSYSDRRVCVLKGSSVEISCAYNSNYKVISKFWFSPKQSHRWRNKLQPEDLSRDPDYTGRVLYSREKGTRSTLTITDLRETDSADYRFQFKGFHGFEWGMDLPGTSLTVTGLQVKVTPSTVTEGQSVTLTCSTTCFLPGDLTYIWYKNRQRLTNPPGSRHEFLSLGPVSSEDMSSYSCAVKGHEHITSTEETLTVRYKPKNLNVSVSSCEPVEGSRVLLYCSSEANPPVQSYTWYKLNESPVIMSEHPEQVFSPVQSSNSGEYYCEAQNEMGTTNSGFVTINVKYGPRNISLAVSPSGEIVEGSSVTLTCSNDANPLVDRYTWYKKNVTVLRGYGGELNFSSVRGEDSGVYHCEAENEYGQQNSSYQLIDVQYSPKTISLSVSPSGGIEEGSSVTLTCSSDANPPAGYVIFRGSVVVFNGTGQNYSISSTRSEDNGLYHCEARNHRGALNSTTQLIVVAGKQTYAAAVGITVVVLLAVIPLVVCVWLRQKRTFKSSSKSSNLAETEMQDDSGPIYDNISCLPLSDTTAVAQCTHTEQREDNIHYASVRFSCSENQEVAFYSTVQPHQTMPLGDDVEYALVKWSAATPCSRTHTAEEPIDMYSTVNKHRA